VRTGRGGLRERHAPSSDALVRRTVRRSVRRRRSPRNSWGWLQAPMSSGSEVTSFKRAGGQTRRALPRSCGSRAGRSPAVHSAFLQSARTPQSRSRRATSRRVRRESMPPTFNFFLLRALKKLGVPVVYYISPSSGHGGRGACARCSASSTRSGIFPFEEEIYQRAGVPVTFVGHPLVDMARADRLRTGLLTELGLDPAAPTLAILPGSRANEVRRIAPTMAEAMPLIRAVVPELQCVDRLCTAPVGRVLRRVRPGPRRACPGPFPNRRRAGGKRCGADRVRHRPPCSRLSTSARWWVVYRLSPLTYRVGKPFVRVDTYAHGQPGGR
jgi:hypothetical protein